MEPVRALLFRTNFSLMILCSICILLQSWSFVPKQGMYSLHVIQRLISEFSHQQNDSL